MQAWLAWFFVMDWHRNFPAVRVTGLCWAWHRYHRIRFDQLSKIYTGSTLIQRVACGQSFGVVFSSLFIVVTRLPFAWAVYLLSWTMPWMRSIIAKMSSFQIHYYYYSSTVTNTRAAVSLAQLCCNFSKIPLITLSCLLVFPLLILSLCLA